MRGEGDVGFAAPVFCYLLKGVTNILYVRLNEAGMVEKDP
jgi:hypothetical protein